MVKSKNVIFVLSFLFFNDIKILTESTYIKIFFRNVWGTIMKFRNILKEYSSLYSIEYKNIQIYWKNFFQKYFSNILQIFFKNIFRVQEYSKKYFKNTEFWMNILHKYFKNIFVEYCRKFLKVREYSKRIFQEY